MALNLLLKSDLESDNSITITKYRYTNEKYTSQQSTIIDKYKFTKSSQEPKSTDNTISIQEQQCIDNDTLFYYECKLI